MHGTYVVSRLSSCKRQQVESRVETCTSATKAPSVTVAGAMRPTVLIASGPEREIRVAADEAILGSVRNSVVDDVTAAVAAATGALDAWRRSAPHERSTLLTGLSSSAPMAIFLQVPTG
jgi:acyl-CoA reductase-like NAD-dependent aldehyde dehydrogenase